MAEKEQDGYYRAIILKEYKYFYKGEIKTVTSEIVLGGLKSVSAPHGPITQGEIIGIMGNSPYLSSRLRELDPFMIRTSFTKPLWDGSFWWYSPDWIQPSTTNFLSFRPVDSLEEAIDDFYNRWFIEGDEAKGVTLHYFPNLDRIRVLYKIMEFPKPLITESKALRLTELQFYAKQGIFTLVNRIDRGAKYSAVLYWQKGFDRYLKEEYSLESPIWLYCSIYALDHEKREIIICVRDFALQNDQVIIENRIMELLK